jgi:hypothetical protein
MNSDRIEPDFDVLLDWVEGRLDPAVAANVGEQVAQGGDEIQATVAWLRRFHATARAFPLYDPPGIVRQGLGQYFAVWSGAQTGVSRTVTDLGLRLVFDSRKDHALLGVRATSPSQETIHLEYAGEGVDLLLDARRDRSGRFRLDGQVLPWDPVTAPVFGAWVTVADFHGRARDGDRLGRFTICDIPAGAGQLRASNGEITVVAELDLETGWS